MPGGKAARWGIDELAGGMGRTQWFAAPRRRHRRPSVIRGMADHFVANSESGSCNLQICVSSTPRLTSAESYDDPSQCSHSGSAELASHAGAILASESQCRLPAVVLASASAIAAQNGISVVSTWKGEDGAKRDQIASHSAVAGLIETPDPGKPSDTNGPVSDNQVRPALSTWRGLEELERRGATGLVAKIRSDQTNLRYRARCIALQANSCAA